MKSSDISGFQPWFYYINPEMQGKTFKIQQDNGC